LGFLSQAIFLHFPPSAQFESLVIVGILKVHEWFDLDVWTFKLRFDVDILAIFGFVTFWLLFQKCWHFFSDLLVTLPSIKTNIIMRGAQKLT
jgi:hypothetical protein